MAFAEKQGIVVIDSYIDRALSAKTDNRPQFQKMIKDSIKKKFDVIIVWKLDRFARNRYDSARYKNVLKKNNVRVVSATETYLMVRRAYCSNPCLRVWLNIIPQSLQKRLQED